MANPQRNTPSPEPSELDLANAKIAELEASGKEKDARIAELESVAGGLEDVHSAYTGRIAELEANCKEKDARIAELEAMVETQESALVDSFEKMNQLEEILSSFQKGGKPVFTGPKEFEYEEKTYPFPAPSWIHPGRGKVTVEQALGDPTILAELVEMKAGNIN